MILDKHDFGGAAAERFDADGSRAGENIDEMCAGNLRTEHVEKRLAKPVARGTERESSERFQQPRTVFSSNDAHAKKVA